MTTLLRRLPQLLLFALVFSIEVRVRAESAQFRKITEPVSLPRGCAAEKLNQKTNGCAIATGEAEAFKFSVNQTRIVLSERTSIVRLSETELRLVAGTIWIRPAEDTKFTVRTEFGTATSDTEYWVERASDRMTVSAIGGDLELLGRGSASELIVERALTNFVGRIGQDGKAVTGLPIPLSPAPYIERWAKLFDGKKEDFEKQLTDFKSVWQKAVEVASETHRILYERKVASLQTAEDERRAARLKVEARNRELREAFRAKFLSGE